jgi:O-antigen/teichoic acid export membrane protein
MSTATINQLAPAVDPEVDRTGRSRLVSNVLFTWAGQMVFFVSGFIMPRMIDHKLGQEVLGVWDFSWSLVTYFRFVDFGISSSVNRYVARHWGKQDILGINQVVSSATFALAIAALGILLATVVAVLTLPYWFGARLHAHVTVTQQSVFFLGVMLALGAALGPFNGVLTGCHRWKLQSIRLGVWQFITVAAMMVALWLGAGLATLAAITAIGQTLANLTLVGLAFRVCPGLRLRWSFVKWKTIKELYVYSGKTLLPTCSDMLLNQTTSLLILGSLGPAALAVFSRPRSLLKQMDSLERKMSMVLTPTTSSLESGGHEQEIGQLLVKSVRYSIYLVLPMVFVLVFFGGQVLHLWMGPAYANGLLPAILAIGFLGTCIQTPILFMLEGLNAHGRAGLGQFVGSALSAGAVFVALKLFNGGLVAAAVAVTVPLLIVNVLYLPVLLCRRLGNNLGEFYRSVAVAPLIHVLPFALCLVVGRSVFKSHPVPALALCVLGGLILAIIYWRCVLPPTLKSIVMRHSHNFSKRLGLSRVMGTNR